MGESTASSAESKKDGWMMVVNRRLVPLVVASLVVLVGLRVVGPMTRLWFDNAIIWSIGAMLACLISFASAILVDHRGRQLGQPVGGPLLAIGLRTGGVGVAAVVASVAAGAAESRWFLLSLASCYVVALFVDTFQWAKDSKLASSRPSQDGSADVEAAE